MLFGSIACSERNVYTAENDQIKYFVQTSFLKSHFFLCKLLLDFATSSVNYFSLSLWSLSEDFSTIQVSASSTLH